MSNKHCGRLPVTLAIFREVNTIIIALLLQWKLNSRKSSKGTGLTGHIHCRSYRRLRRVSNLELQLTEVDDRAAARGHERDT